MATKSKGGVLLPAVLLVGVMVYFGGSEVIDWGEGIIDDLFSAAYVTAPGAKPRTDKCTTDQILQERRCGDLKVVQIDAEKMPFIARNIQLAWGEGKPFVLHKGAPGTDGERRAAVCGRFKAQFPKGSCDEYAFASSMEGGTAQNVRIDEVPLREQNCQGGTLRQEYRRVQISEGDAFMVVITSPGKIADKPYSGVDIAKELSCGT